MSTKSKSKSRPSTRRSGRKSGAVRKDSKQDEYPNIIEEPIRVIERTRKKPKAAKSPKK